MSIEDRAREWMDKNTSMRLTTEPEYGIPAIELNRRYTRLQQRLIDFAKSEFPREREEAVREFIEKWRAKTMEHFENDIWTSADAEVFKEIFGKDL
jgi:hypothetical protein